MEEIRRRLGIRIPGILFPAEGTDLYKWAVIACDQFTSQPEYWEEVARIVGDAPSTLHMVYPEIYLGKEDAASRIGTIASAMERYIREGVLCALPPGVMVTCRKSADTMLTRTGIMLNVDLECYDYGEGSKSMIRATEGTIMERIPPRLAIRARADLEVPHVMMLIDDAGHTVIGPLAAYAKSRTETVYDTELMLDGGRVSAWHVSDEGALERMTTALNALLSRSAQRGEDSPILFAVGDGNHSLAAAKAHWENVKKTLSEDRRRDHPARFALCEVVNLYDEGIRLEPIHRLLFNVEAGASLAFLLRHYRDNGMQAELSIGPEIGFPGHQLQYSSAKGAGYLRIVNPASNVPADTLQSGLDALLEAFPAARIDYIHGRETLDALSGAPGCLGFRLPQMKKEGLFETVMKGGVLPRKAFSIGEAVEKRYYMECRRIRP